MRNMVEPAGPKSKIFERRKYIRIEGRFVISYTDITSAQSRSDVSQTRNISEGGMLFTTDRKFDQGTLLRVKFRLLGSPDYINAKAKVISSTTMGRGVMFDTRVQLIGIREEDRDAIKRLVEYHLQNNQRGKGKI